MRGAEGEEDKAWAVETIPMEGGPGKCSSKVQAGVYARAQHLPFLESDR